MDKIVIDGTFSSDVLNINNDSYVLINEDVHAKDFKINIINCRATIMDNSKIENKNIRFENASGSVIEIISENINKSLNIDNRNSNIEYNVIDLLDSCVNYKIEEKIGAKNSNTNINIASISYNNVVKDYTIYTSNEAGNSINEISCFGIVKDKSLLNYDVTSFIKQGAKQSVVRQNSSILLFDEESVGKNNPILLIEENDVKASHGSSIGKIDDDTMFYLCSRGLTRSEATNLICLGKLEYLIKKIDDEKIKETLINNFKERMG